MKIKLEDFYKDKDWKKFKKSPVIPLGAETATHNLVATLANGLDLIVGGKKGSGKSTFLRCAMRTLLKNTNPKSLKLILIDTKKKDLVEYRKLRNLLFPVVTNQKSAVRVIKWCLKEMDRRLIPSIAVLKRTRKDDNFDKNITKVFPKIVIVINGYSDLVKGKEKFFEEEIANLCHSGLVNIHLIVINTEPSKGKIYPKSLVDAFNGRIVFNASRTTSKALIGKGGAEKLRNPGELYYRNFHNAAKQGDRRGVYNMKPEGKTYRVQGFHIETFNR